MDDERLDYYVRGWLDALDTFENFRDTPAKAFVAQHREWIAQRHPEAVQRASVIGVIPAGE